MPRGPAVRVQFPGGSGHRLTGWFEQPDGTPRGYAVLAHCFTCGKDLKGPVRLSRHLAAGGIGVLRFDFTGLGESEGHFAETGLGTNRDDIVAAARELQSRKGSCDLLIGHSLGGTAALLASASLPQIRGVALIAAPLDLDPLRERLLAQDPEAGSTKRHEVLIGGRRWPIGNVLLEDLAASRVAESVARFRRSLLILHSPQDRTVDFQQALELLTASGGISSLMALEGADHLLSRTEDAEDAAAILTLWARRLL